MAMPAQVRDTSAMTIFDPTFKLQPRLQQVSYALAEADFAALPDANVEDHEAHAAGETCARCYQEIKSGEDVRRNAKHAWLHESCPVPRAGRRLVLVGS
jgi:hypothetical protein